ncbi:MAG: tetratricopeptide repeat protein, partial [Phycisphaerae bacterium]
LGRHETGLALLHRALAVDPDSALGQYRLALAYDRLGRPADAIPHYEAAVAASPGHNPTINRLAEAYQRVGRLADARKAYEKSLANNPGYEVDAILGLAALDIQEGSTRSYLLAKRRLTDLLAWMPENVAARVNLGVVRSALGQQQPAMREYRLALDQEPSNVTALLNLGQLEHAAGREDRAAELFRRALDAGLQSPEQAVVVHDFLLTRSKISQAVDVWRRVVDTFPDSMMARGFLAWSHALNGQPTQAKEVIAELSNEPGDGFAERPIVVAALAYLSFVESRYEPATRRIATLCRQRDAAAKDARQRLLGAFERFDTDHPNRPWTYCLTARLLIAEGRLKAAGVFVGLCKQWCPPSAPCQGELQTLRSQMERGDAPGGASGHRSKSDAVR